MTALRHVIFATLFRRFGTGRNNEGETDVSIDGQKKTGSIHGIVLDQRAIYSLASLLAGKRLNQSGNYATYLASVALTDNVGSLMPATKVALSALLAEEPWVSDPVIKEIFEPTEPETKKAFSLVDQLRDDDHVLVRALIGSMRSGSLRLGGSMLSRAVSMGYTDQNGTLFDTTKNALATLLTEEPWAKDPALTDNWTNDIEAIARTDMAVAISAVDTIARYMSGLYHALWYMYREGQELMLTPEFQHLKEEGTGSSYLGKVVLANGRFMPSVRAVFEMMDTNGLGPKHTSLPVPDDAILQKLLEAGESHVFVRRFDSAEALEAFERLLLGAEMRDLGKRLRTLDVKLATALSRHNFS